MTLALAFNEAKEASTPKDRSRGFTPFFGSRGNSELPQAHIATHAPGSVSRVHFHIVDQFQVILDGKGRIGRHDYSAYSVHFSRAYTPYGPLVADAGTGFIHFGLRPHCDPGSQFLPKELDQLKRVPNRKPWQITHRVAFPTGLPAKDIIVQAIPEIKDDQGLAAYTMSMKPNTKTYAPDPSRGDGQYLVVIKGSLWHQNSEYKAWALVFVYPEEGPFQIQAGSEGLEALVLNFPSSQTKVTDAAKNVQARNGLRVWQCAQCAFVYDEAAGLPEEGIAPGTPWQDVPDTWSCPDCSASKVDFQMIEVTGS